MRRRRQLALASISLLTALLAGGATRILQDQCGPFTDVSPALCPFVSELYYLGITAGTSATTFSPDDPLTRGQGAVFVAKGLNQSLARSSRRAALGQWWTTTPHYDLGLGLTYVPLNPSGGVACDGADIWAASTNEFGAGAVTRIRASDGRSLDTWNVPYADAVLVAMGRIFVGSNLNSSGSLLMIDPTQPPEPVSSVSGPFPGGVSGLTFDGQRIWTANYVVGGGSVSVVTPASSTPWPFTTVTAGIVNPFDVLFDGASVWVVDNGTVPGSLLRLDAAGSVIQTVAVGLEPRYATFDGANIWVPNLSGSLSVVQASTGAVLATLTGNGLNIPWAAAFDGDRILVSSVDGSLALFKAADFSPIGVSSVGALSGAYGVCSDGVNFWVADAGPHSAIGRF